MSQWFTAAEAAAYLNVTRRWMYRAVEERRIAYSKVGGLLRFHQRDLDAYMDAHRVEAAS